MGDISTKSFSWEGIGEDERNRALYLSNEIRKGAGRCRAELLALGNNLYTANLLFHQYGLHRFCEWLEFEVRISKTTAYQAIRSFRSFEAVPEKHMERIEVGAVRVLTANDAVPPEALTKAIKTARGGDTVTRDDAVRLIADARGGPAEDTIEVHNLLSPLSTLESLARRLFKKLGSDKFETISQLIDDIREVILAKSFAPPEKGLKWDEDQLEAWEGWVQHLMSMGKKVSNGMLTEYRGIFAKLSKEKMLYEISRHKRNGWVNWFPEEDAGDRGMKNEGTSSSSVEGTLL